MVSIGELMVIAGGVVIGNTITAILAFGLYRIAAWVHDTAR